MRVAGLLEVAAALAHAERASFSLTGFDELLLDDEGRPLGLSIAVQPTRVPTQELLTQAAYRLFGSNSDAGSALAFGGGEAKAAVASLLERWRQCLTPLSPVDAVDGILRAAPFLWWMKKRDHLAALALAVEDDVWFAAPTGARRRLFDRGRVPEDLEKTFTVLKGPTAQAAWLGIAASTLEPGPPEQALAKARELERAGHLFLARRVLASQQNPDALLLRARIELALGEVGTAAHGLRALRRREPPLATQIDSIELALRLSKRCLDSGALAAEAVFAEHLLEAAAQAGDEVVLGRAQLAGAWAALDNGDLTLAAELLDQAEEAREPDRERLARRHQAAAQLAFVRGQWQDAESHLGRALGAVTLRPRPRALVGGLWNEMALARAAGGDLRGAERALRHALRHLRACDGPSHLALATSNLAEIAVRRGRVSGVEAVLDACLEFPETSRNRAARAAEEALAVRLLMVRGALEDALRLCRPALEDATGSMDKERLALAARCLAWSGRVAEAAELLEQLADHDLDHLEPEERLAVLLQAGQKERAQQLNARLPAPLRRFWSPIVAHQPALEVSLPAIDALRLEPYRAARLVLDLLQLGVPVAPPLATRSARVMRDLGARAFAGRIEDASDPWSALAELLVPEENTKRLGLTERIERLFASLSCARGGVSIGDETAPLRKLVLRPAPTDAVTVSLVALNRRVELALVAQDFERLGRSRVRVLAWAIACAAWESTLAEERPGRGHEPLFVAEDVAEDVADNVAEDDVGAKACDGLRRSETAEPNDGIVGRSAPLLEALENVSRLAPAAIPVLVLGETGTGKELIARRLHALSRRAEKRFLAVNCATLQNENLVLAELFGHAKGAFTGAHAARPGVFESAHEGTVFLDEIGDLPENAQGMLLRVLQEGEVRRLGELRDRSVDVRIVAATHNDLALLVREGRFRQDLYFRLAGALVELPPLRERGSDAELLAAFFLERLDPWARLADCALRAIREHTWPGNVRQLQNALAVAVTFGAVQQQEPWVLTAEHLGLGSSPQESPEHAAPSETATYRECVFNYRRQLIADALERSGGNQAAAARQLGLKRQSLRYNMKALGLL